MSSAEQGGRKATFFRLLSGQLHVEDSHAKGGGIAFQFRNLFYIFSHFRVILTLFDANTSLLVLFGLCYPNFHQSQGGGGRGGERPLVFSAKKFLRIFVFHDFPWINDDKNSTTTSSFLNKS